MNVSRLCLHDTFASAPIGTKARSPLLDELAPWWMPRHRMTNAYIDAYMDRYAKHSTLSEPTEDFADRGTLYGL